MRKIFLTFALLSLLAGNASAVCCPGPICKDGTINFWNCGAGPDEPLWPGGCFFITSCGCSACRTPKNKEQWNEYCDKSEGICKKTCRGDPFLIENTSIQECIRVCESNRDNCYNSYPGSD